jgi:hypothetical protein
VAVFELFALPRWAALARRRNTSRSAGVAEKSIRLENASLLETEGVEKEEDIGLGVVQETADAIPVGVPGPWKIGSLLSVRGFDDNQQKKRQQRVPAISTVEKEG